MDMIRIMVAFGSDSQSVKIKNLLLENGYSVAYIAKDGQECLRKARLLKPDLVVLDFDLPLSTGYDVAKVLSEDKICNTLLIVNENQKSLINEHKDDWDFTTLIKPINKSALISTIKLIVRNNKKIKELEKEIVELKDSLDTRKLLEKAKGMIMKQYGLSEQEAFRRIQKQSMDKGITMKDLAKAIIIANSI